MRKIYLKESSVSNVLNKRLLPQFLYKMVKTHTTSLGDNSMFPNDDEYPFDYVLLKTRYNEVCDAMEELGMTNLNEDELVSELSKLVKECKELEKPIRDTLERICENSVNRLFAIPSEMINFNCKLVDKIKFKKAIRLRPETNEDIKYTFTDVDDIEFSKKAIEKRRFINSLIQGGAYLYANVIGLYLQDIDKVNKDLIPLYRRITTINDYLLFTKEEEMTDDKPMQGSYVETHLGNEDERTTITAQGIIFPLLLQETIRGMFELFSAHGLPKDINKAKYIIRKSDFVLAEPWDLRLGVGLWKKIFGKVQDTNMIPYMFTNLIRQPIEEFNVSIKEILASTAKGDEIIDSLIQNAEYDSGYQQFSNRINARNLDKSVINDSYFSGAETNGLEIDNETNDDDVIEEDEDTDVMGQYEAQPTKPMEYYQQLVQNATVESIGFLEGNVNGVTKDLIVTINGEIIPRTLILLMTQIVKIRISEDERVPMTQVHIILNENIQRLGLAPKIYKKLIYTFGVIYSGEGRRINKEHIAKVYEKLAQDPSLYVYHDDMCYIAMKREE